MRVLLKLKLLRMDFGEFRLRVGSEAWCLRSMSPTELQVRERVLALRGRLNEERLFTQCTVEGKGGGAVSVCVCVCVCGRIITCQVVSRLPP